MTITYRIHEQTDYNADDQPEHCCHYRISFAFET